MSGPAVGRLRGKTSAGRLRLWDALCAARFPAVCARGVVDVGLGERADTTVELLESLGQPVLALEVHPTRVAWARERRRGRPIEILEVDALLGAGEGPRGGLLRCANVLRQYPVEAVAQAHSALCSWVEEGGIVLEGSCDKEGHVGAMHILQRAAHGPHRRALAFVTDFRRGFAPIQLRDHLPRDLRRQVRPGGCLMDFFARWSAAWQDTRAGDPAEDFRRAAAALGAEVELVELGSEDDPSAALIWSPAAGVPRPGGSQPGTQ